MTRSDFITRILAGLSALFAGLLTPQKSRGDVVTEPVDYSPDETPQVEWWEFGRDGYPVVHGERGNDGYGHGNTWADPVLGDLCWLDPEGQVIFHLPRNCGKTEAIGIAMSDATFGQTVSVQLQYMER